MTRVNQYRTNPSQAVSNFKGRWDSVFAWPSTAVSTWHNGGLFGAAWATIDGGTEVLYTGYHAEKFTGSGTLTVSAPGYVEILVVGGGGGGAATTSSSGGGGGGGGGAVRAQSADLNEGADGYLGITGWVYLEAGDYTVSVGGGGADGSGSSTHYGAMGTQSYIQAPSGTPFHDGTSASAYMRAGPGGGGGGGTGAGRNWNQGTPTGVVAATGGSGGGGGQGNLGYVGSSGGAAGSGGGTMGNNGGAGGYVGMAHGGNPGGGGGGAGSAAGGGSSYGAQGGDPTQAYTTTQWEGTTKWYGGGGGGHIYQFNGTSYAFGSAAAGGHSTTGYSGYGPDTDIAGSGTLAGTDGTMRSNEGTSTVNTTGSGGWGRGYVGNIGNGLYSTSTSGGGNAEANTINANVNSGGGGGGSGYGSVTAGGGDGGSGIVIVRVGT